MRESGRVEASQDGSIAIVGIGCRFPGGASDPESFWGLLVKGLDAISEVPGDRWNVETFCGPNPAEPGKIISRWGGFLDQVDLFDPYFFGISPREAACMDPQQRILLEVAWEAVEDAGVDIKTLEGTETGVYIGISTHDYGNIQARDYDRVTAYMNTGIAMSVAANRISYVFNLKGPSMAVDTACSSSLLAIHLACQGIRSGEASVALAGGVNLILTPALTLGFSKASMLSPEGRCRPFDSRANGYVRSEGAGIIVLKPLRQALANRDRIYAVIRGSAVYQDGRTAGISLPNQAAQEAVLRRACEAAGVAPAEVKYVEAHGTGTPAGDPIEFNALASALGAQREPGAHCAVGSVKGNIGHPEAAAGVAGVIKVALALRHKRIPASLHFSEPNPHLSLETTRLKIQQELGPWPNGPGRAVAGVNSFGFGGTNVHVVLEEAPGCAEDEERRRSEEKRPKGEYLVPLSARSHGALQALAREYLKLLEAGAGIELGDIAYSASMRRSHHDCRAAFAAGSTEDLREKLRVYVAGEAPSPVRRQQDAAPKIVFVYTGMGPQWWGMGRELLNREPAFREMVEGFDSAFTSVAGWSILREMEAEETSSRMAETEVAQPAIFAIQAGLTALWRSWGVEPAAVIGHSVGEVTSLYVAGIYSLEDAARISFHRSRLQHRASGNGTMAAVGLPLGVAAEIIEKFPGRIAIAAINSPSAVTLSGDEAALKEVVGDLERAGVFCRMLNVNGAFHGPVMDGLRDELLSALRTLDPRRAAVPVYSTAIGKPIEGPEGDAHYWWQNVRRPVLFWEAIRHAIENGHSVFLEIGPHPVLSTYILECLSQAGVEGTSLSSLRRGEGERLQMLSSLASIYELGGQVKWDRFLTGDERYVRLPAYPWQRERYWKESAESRDERLGTDVHPLLGRRQHTAIPAWQAGLSKERTPYIQEHVVQGQIVMPGAAYVEMALAAASEILGADNPCVLEGIEFVRPLVLAGTEWPIVQVIYCSSSREIEVYSRERDDLSAYTLHARARFRETKGITSGGGRSELEAIERRCAERRRPEGWFEEVHRRGLRIGPAFQGIRAIMQGDKEALTEISVHESIKPEVHKYRVHPTVLDACFQSILLASLARNGQGEREGLFLPVSVDRARYWRRPNDTVLCHTRVVTEDNVCVTGNATVLNQNGDIVLEIEGLRVKHVEGSGVDLKRRSKEWFYKLEWQAAEIPAATTVGGTGSKSWVVFDCGAGFAAKLAEGLRSRGDRSAVVSAGSPFKWRRAGTDGGSEKEQELGEALGAIEKEWGRIEGMIYLAADEAASSEVPAHVERLCGELIELVHQTAERSGCEGARLWIVTNRAQQYEGDDRVISIDQSALWGLGRVIINEHPALNCTMVDLSGDGDETEMDMLVKELTAERSADEILLRKGQRYIRKLVRTAPYNPDGRGAKRVKLPASEAFCLRSLKPGILNSLALSEAERRSPGPGEVEVRVMAAGLNFKDVMVAMDMLPLEAITGGGTGIALGMECAGRIARVGAGVANLREGDRVMALAPASFGAFTVTRAEYVLGLPGGWSLEEGATVPVAFLTAYYSLLRVARLAPGERVLIHSAAGGVGLAAVQLALRAGAEVFATAGSDEKRAYLRSLGVGHVLDSRSASFADEILKRTANEGVDVILNSLADELMKISARLLRPYGRFIEIGKRDVYGNNTLGLRLFAKNASYSVVDIDRLLMERPDWVRGILEKIVKLFEQHELTPLPHTAFGIQEATDAFRYMAQARHIGKIVLTFGDGEAEVQPRCGEKLIKLEADASYIVTGGLGGFGLAVARWMAERGAGSLVLIGRSGTGEAAGAIAEMRKRGTTVHVVKADVSQREQAAEALRTAGLAGRRLRGVIHAAGVFEDGVLLQTDKRRLARVLAPKVAGAWNLHGLTETMPLDFFVLFSSVSAISGNKGQASYAAANAFLDGLAHFRRSNNLPAVSVNWGAIADVGEVARSPEARRHLTRQGVTGFGSGDATRLLELVLQQNPAQVVVADIAWGVFGDANPSLAKSPRFIDLVQAARDEQIVDGGGREEDLGVRIRRAADGRESAAIVQGALSEQIARIFGVPASNLDPSRPIIRLGLDSLMAVECMNWIQDKLGVRLSMMDIMRGPSIAQLAAEIAGRVVSGSANDVGNGR